VRIHKDSKDAAAEPPATSAGAGKVGPGAASADNRHLQRLKQQEQQPQQQQHQQHGDDAAAQQPSKASSQPQPQPQPQTRARSGTASAGDFRKENAWAGIAVEIGVAPWHFKRLPRAFREGAPIVVTPVLITVGINETQTLSNAMGTAALQHEINQRNLTSLMAYYAAYRPHHAAAEALSEIVTVDALDTLLAALERLVSSPKNDKNIQVLALADEFSRAISAARIISCKSAKDRTSQSITFAQARILHQREGLPLAAQAQVMSMFRMDGVRMANAEANVGKRSYAFNAFQRRFLPSMYRPPKGTTGKGKVQA
jgi:hypothetical protein